MSFEPENELEQTLLKAVTDHASAPAFYRQLMDSEVLVLGTVHGREEEQERFTLAPGGQIKLVPGEAEGKKFLPVFTSLTRMQAYVQAESKYLGIRCRDVLEMTRGVAVHLNPGSDFARLIPPEEIQELLGGPARANQPKTITGEVDYPQQLVDALTALFETRTDAASAWMIQVTFADRAREPHPLVGVEFDSEGAGAMSSLMPQIERMAEIAAPGLVFDVQRVDRKQQMGMADALLQVPPFYQRGQASSAPLN